MVTLRVVGVVQDRRAPLAAPDDGQPVPNARRVVRADRDPPDHQLHEMARLVDHLDGEARRWASASDMRDPLPGPGAARAGPAHRREARASPGGGAEGELSHGRDDVMPDGRWSPERDEVGAEELVRLAEAEGAASIRGGAVPPSACSRHYREGPEGGTRWARLTSSPP